MKGLPIQLLVDLAVEHNIPPNEYFAQWNEFSAWQFETLLALGMRPNHRLLDVGCGGLRLGVKAVDYLDDGHYVGLDAYPPYLDFGRALLNRVGVKKSSQLYLTSAFDISTDGPKFDFAIAQSVFTHLGRQASERCLRLIERGLARGGKFVFTYLDGAASTAGFLYNGTQPMERPVEIGATFFDDFARASGFDFSILQIPHPTGQMVAMLHRPLK